jgi:hypothetical protein
MVDFVLRIMTPDPFVPNTNLSQEASFGSVAVNDEHWVGFRTLDTDNYK